MKDRKWMNRLKDDKLVILGFVMIVLSFYFAMVRGGIATHDELANFYQVRMGTFFSELNWGRWSMTFMNTLPNYLQGLAQNQWVYRIYTIIGLMIACGGFAMLLKKITNRAVAWIAVLMFFMFAQIQQDHDGLIAFSFSYQFNTVYVFISLALYWDWLHERKNSQLVVSALLYLLACMTYEAFVGYGVLYFILDLIYQADRGKIRIKDLFKDLILHLCIAVIYFVIYVLVRRSTNFANSDTTVGTGITIGEILKTDWKLATGLFPLNYMPMGKKKMLQAMFTISGENAVRWGIAIFLAVIIYRLARESSEIGLKRWLQITVFCWIGAMLPGAPAALTDQMIDWLCYRGIKSYGLSYYSYFFLIAWIAVTMVFIYQVLKRKKAILAVCCAATAAVTVMTMIGNEVYVRNINELQDKYDLFCEMVETEEFGKIEDDAVLYAPNYIGIHSQIPTVAGYANGRTGKQLTSVNEKADIDFSKPVYLMREDTEKDVICLSRITEDGYTDEVFIYALEDVEGLGLLAKRRAGAEPAMMKVDGKSRNFFGDEIITGDLQERGKSMVIQCAGMKAESIELYEASDRMSNGTLKLSGVYGLEGWGRWAQKEMRISFENTGETEIKGILRLKVAMPTKVDGEITIRADGFEQKYPISKDAENATEIEAEIGLKPGKNEITVASDGEDLVINGDRRKMNFRVLGMELVIGEETFEMMNIPESE